MKKVRLLLPALLAVVCLMMAMPADAAPHRLYSRTATELCDRLTAPTQEEQQEKIMFKDGLGSMHISCPRPAKVIPSSGSHPGKPQTGRHMPLPAHLRPHVLTARVSFNIFAESWEYSRHYYVIALRHILC